MATFKDTSGASRCISKGTRVTREVIREFWGKKHHAELYLQAVTPAVNDGAVSCGEWSVLWPEQQQTHRKAILLQICRALALEWES